jgi:hypothetical protein
MKSMSVAVATTMITKSIMTITTTIMKNMSAAAVTTMITNTIITTTMKNMNVVAVAAVIMSMDIIMQMKCLQAGA